jgi:DNA replication protein DnaC
METAPTTETTECRKCGSPIEYEPILVMGKDLAKALHSHCEACANAAREESARLEKEAATDRARAALRAILPPDLFDTDINHPEFNAALWSIVKMWSPTPREHSIGIIGPAAKCKTRVMALLAKRVVHRGSRIMWTSAVRLADSVRDRNSRIHAVSTVAREHIEDCRCAPWLFLDDLGKNEWDRSFESQIFQILDHRIGYRLPMVWSANDHPETFSQLITPLNAGPIIGRLLDRTTIFDLRK